MHTGLVIQRIHYKEKITHEIIVLCCAWSLTCVQLFATPWTVACKAPLSMGTLQARIWSRLLCPPAGDLPDPGIKPRSPALQMDSLPSEAPEKPRLDSSENMSNNMSQHELQFQGELS